MKEGREGTWEVRKGESDSKFGHILNEDGKKARLLLGSVEGLVFFAINLVVTKADLGVSRHSPFFRCLPS